MKRFRIVFFVLVLVALPAGIFAAVSQGGGSDTTMAPVVASDDSRAPEGARIRVEVRNASTVQGLARRATFHLRDRGFDVVESGNAEEKHDSTIVLDRSRNPEWARLVANAMGEGTPVVESPDSTRYVDVTVLVGPSWRPPPKPFYP